jgi:hypothetical protein
MKERKVSKTIVGYISCIAVAMICVGCPQEHSSAASGAGDEKVNGQMRNLDDLSCPDKRTDANVEIVATKEVLANPGTSILLPCTGDTITWFTKDPKLQIVVAFQGEKAEELFEGETTLFLSGPDGKTPTGTVEKPKHPRLVHKYSIWVTQPGKERYHIDPHVIPMGK